jgi:hypothetical protein
MCFPLKHKRCKCGNQTIKGAFCYSRDRQWNEVCRVWGKSEPRRIRDMEGDVVAEACKPWVSLVSSLG